MFKININNLEELFQITDSLNNVPLAEINTGASFSVSSCEDLAEQREAARSAEAQAAAAAAAQAAAAEEARLAAEQQRIAREESERQARQERIDRAEAYTEEFIEKSSVNLNIQLPPVYGKKNLYVLSENVGFTSDNFRFFMENYWNVEGNELKIKTQFLPAEIENVVSSLPSISSNLIAYGGLLLTRNFLSQGTFNLNQLYDDIVFETNYAFTGQQIKFGQVDLEETEDSKYIEDALDSSLIVSVENDYNFYIPKYEKLQADEKELPNFYILMTNELELNSPQNNFHPNHKKVLTLDNGLTLEATGDEFYDVFSINFPSIVADKKQYVSNKMKNVIFSNVDYKKFKEFQSYSTDNKREKTAQKGKKEQVPFYTKVEIQTEEFGPINKRFKESGFIDMLMSYVSTKQQEGSLTSQRFHKAEISAEPDPVSIETIPFINLFDALEDISSVSFDRANTTYLGSLEKKIDDFEETDLRIQELFLYSTLKSLHFNYQNTLTYLNNLSGAKSYAETVFYKIKKYDSNNNLIQSFFIPNIEDLDALSIIDSQIKYGKKYRYDVEAYKVVLGTQYQYTNIDQFFSSNILEIETYPRMYLVGVPYCSVEARISDKPPAPPEVDIVSYKDNDSDLLFLLNTSTVEYDLMPVFLNDQENERYNRIRESQQVLQGQKIRFGGEDRAKEFWIYRLETHPFSITEFEDALWEKVETKCAAATGFADTLMPNKKYYYIFRTLDVHDNLSNPSSLWEVELISENGMSFLKTEIVEFNKKEFKKETKNIKRYLHIRPSLKQIAIDDSSLDLTKTAEQVIEQTQLGSADIPVWGQKYKIRIKSKNTNKFIDIYFTFKQERKPQNLTNLEETCE